MEDQINWGEAEYIDYFVWAEGEGDVVGATRMGGRPDLPGMDHWPRDVHGGFLPFIGQINFSDSRDLVDVPRDLLLIFAHVISGLVEESKLLWFDPGEVSRLDSGSIPATAFEISPHHGHICRLPIFGDASPHVAPQDHYVRIRGMRLYRFGELCLPRGTCIGGYSCGERYHAIVNGLTPTPRVIYPFVNRKEPYPFEDWAEACSERERLAPELPLKLIELPGGQSFLCHQTYPTKLFEFVDCGSLLLRKNDDGSFELLTESF